MDWIYFKNAETGGTFEAPDTEGVRERYEALGWTEVDRPVDTPFVPSPVNDAVSADTEWVTLWHPVVKASHEFPNNADAIAGAMESGWEYPKPVKPAPEPKKAAVKKSVATESGGDIRPDEEGE